MLWETFQEDCLVTMKGIESNSIDFIIADPPYLISDKKDYKKKIKSNLDFYKGDKAHWDHGSEIIYECMPEFKRILKRGGSMIIWYDFFKMQGIKEYAEYLKLTQPRLCVWEKTNPTPIGSSSTYLSNSKEMFLYFSKNVVYKKKRHKPIFNSRYDMGIYKYATIGKNKRHDTQKPYKLAEEILLKHTNENSMVYIPFGGSFVDAEVCITNNRNFILSEKDDLIFNDNKKYIEDKFGIKL